MIISESPDRMTQQTKEGGEQHESAEDYTGSAVEEQQKVNKELASHLVQVKLESEEAIFKLKEQVIKLHHQIEATNKQNRSLRQKLALPEAEGSDDEFAPRKLDFGLAQNSAGTDTDRDSDNGVEDAVALTWSQGKACCEMLRCDSMC